MRITSKASCAISALIDLALQQPGTYTSLQSIAARQKISVSHLEHLFAKLRRNALVLSVRGPGGGYALARAACTISIADIAKAVDQHAEQAFDHAMPATGRLTPEALIAESLWARADLSLQCILQDIDLQSLAEPHRKAQAEMSEAAPQSQRSPVLQRPKPIGQTPRARAVTCVFDLAELDI
ncbi:MAG: Rrf2 family transcriptional regulator [Thiomonas sp.]|nr:Rrf2 family transcriptional regulator [Thiomonas sp.]